MSIDVNSQTVDVDRRKLVEDAKSLCGSLIEEGTNGEVVLVHTTAKLYKPKFITCNKAFANSIPVIFKTRDISILSIWRKQIMTWLPSAWTT